MSRTRREFLETVSAATALGTIPRHALGEWPSVRDSSPTDPLGVRADFPLVEDLTYLNGAYTMPSPIQAVRAATIFLEENASNPYSVDEMMEEANSVRRKFARVIHASEPEIGMLFSTSDGENIITNALNLSPGDNVVINDLHYDTSFILYQHLAATQGVEVRIIENRNGATPPEAFEPHIDDRTRLVSVAWVSNQNGYRHDLGELAELAHAYDAYLYADAVQGVGMLDLAVHDVGIDFLAAGGYKWLLGGFGVAPLYVQKDLLDLITVDRLGWGSVQSEEGVTPQSYRFYEDGRKYAYATLAFAAVYQLGAALDYLMDVGISEIERHTVRLAQDLREGLVDQGHEVWTPPDNASAIVTFKHGSDVPHVQADLEAARIRVSLKGGGEQVRAGVALFNNSDEIARFLDITEGWV
jgi:cysteine desulfurase/selenocysteine lyase